jgi:hypothetical protein
LFVQLIAFDLEVISALVPDFEVREHSDKDYLRSQVRVFTKQGRNQDSALVVELTLLRSRNEAPQEGSMLGVNLGKMQCFGFDLIPLFGWIGDEALSVLRENESVGVMLLKDFPEFGGYSEPPLGVEPGY